MCWITLEAWERERDIGCEIKSDRWSILGVLNECLAFRVRRVLSFRLYLICLEMFKQSPSLSGNSVVFYFTTNLKLFICLICIIIQFSHETLDGADWRVVNVTDDIHRVKRLGTRWLVHAAYAANELFALNLYGWLVEFTWHSCSPLSEYLWSPPPSPAQAV